MKDFQYLTCCVNSTGEKINAMTDKAREVTFRTFQKHVSGLAEWANDMGYVRDPQHGGLSLRNDWHVSYHKSEYDGRPCYYLVHSAIEYIFAEGGLYE